MKPWDNDKYLIFCQDDAGYKSFSFRLGYGLSHLLLVTKRPGFLPCVSEDGLWQQLSSQRYTTPMKREWVTELLRENMRRQVVEERNQRASTECRWNDWTESNPPFITKATAFGCRPGVLTLTQDDLDGIVTALVQHGKVRV